MKRHSQSTPLLLVLALASLLAARPTPCRAAPMMLVVEAARDTTAGFRAQTLPELGRRALTWPDGVITLPDTMAWLEHEDDGLAFRLDGDALTGVGSGGRFDIQAGSFKVDTPLYLADGRVVACLAAGRLEVESDRIVYRASGRKRDRRGDLLLLGGIILATAVLLRAARRRSRRA